VEALPALPVKMSVLVTVALVATAAAAAVPR
jgi:hypothetical protein